MTKATIAKMQYIQEYETNNYDRVLVRFPKGTKDRITATGATVNGFTVRAVLQALDNSPALDKQPDTTNDQ